MNRHSLYFLLLILYNNVIIIANVVEKISTKHRLIVLKSLQVLYVNEVYIYICFMKNKINKFICAMRVDTVIINL